MLKAFTVSFVETWAYGGYEYRDGVVVANTESEALGLLLEKYPTTVAKHWSVYEIDLSCLSIDILSQSSS